MRLRTVVLAVVFLALVVWACFRMADVKRQLADYEAQKKQLMIESGNAKSERDNLKLQLAEQQANSIGQRFELVLGLALPLTAQEKIQVDDVIFNLREEIQGDEEDIRDFKTMPKDFTPEEIKALEQELAQAKKRLKNLLAVVDEANKAGLLFKKK